MQPSDWRCSADSGMMHRMSERTLLVGIDEAGYGPLLGPLVVSAAAFEVPKATADACLWSLLRDSVSATASARRSRVPIIDSKKLFSQKDGLARLERAVLSVISAWRGLPPSLFGLLRLLNPDVLEKLPEYPWYRDADPPLPRAADAGAARLAGGLFRRDLQAHAASMAGLWSEVLLEGHFNRLVGGTQNKAIVLSGLTLRLVQRVAETHPRGDLHFHIDKQGGRAAYGRLLLRAFEDKRLKVLEEGPTNSVYELVDSRSRWRISFSQEGESRHLLVALASMISKYARELLMGCFNHYWLGNVPALKPTAGYYQDGLRFLKDIEPHVRRLGVNKNWLVRER